MEDLTSIFICFRAIARTGEGEIGRVRVELNEKVESK